MTALMNQPTDDRQLHYIHRLRYSSRERLTGIFVLGAIVLLVGVLGLSEQAIDLFSEKFELHAYMKNAQGITTETRVKVAGVEVGRVDAINITPDNLIEIRMKIRERFHNLIRVDSTAALNKLSVFGTTSIEITAGSTQLPILPNGGSIRMEEPLSIDDMASNIVPAIRNLNQSLDHLAKLTASIEPTDITTITNSLASITQNAALISDRLSKGRGVAGRMLLDDEFESEFMATLHNLRDTLETTQKRLEEIQPLITTAGKLSENAADATTEVPGLLRETAILIKQLNVTMSTINYEMQQLPDMVLKTLELLEESEETLQAIQNTWPISQSVPPEETAEQVPMRPPND